MDDKTTLLTIKRFIFNADNTISQLFVRFVKTCFGIEDEIRKVKVHGETAIPYGRYPLWYRQSPKFSKHFYWSDSLNILIEAKDWAKLPRNEQTLYRPHDLIWFQNVPDFLYVLLHWGNTDDDTDACYLVGSSLGIIKGQDAVLNSKKTYMKIYPNIYNEIRKGGQYVEVTK